MTAHELARILLDGPDVEVYASETGKYRDEFEIHRVELDVDGDVTLS